MRFAHTPLALEGDYSTQYLGLVEAIALQAAEVFGACEAYEEASLPTWVRLHGLTLRDFASVLDETSVTWSTPANRRRLVTELNMARMDVSEALEIVGNRALKLAPGYLARSFDGLAAMRGALRSIDRVLRCVDYQVPSSVGMTSAEMELAA